MAAHMKLNDIGKPRTGLLPLMLEMYRKYAPDLQQKQESFIYGVRDRLGSFSDVYVAPVCTTRRETEDALRKLESDGIDMVVVIFISYATSISALGPLLNTNLPVLLYSTVPKSSMAEGMTMEDIMLNHGVHGYMDLANVLRRNMRRFQFVCGRMDDRGALDEIEAWARAARVRNALKSSVIGIAGYTFDGMGDFGLDNTYLNASIGPEVRHIPLNLLAENIRSIDDREVYEEVKRDRELYEIEGSVSEDIHREANRIYLGLSKTVEELSLNGFTMHFQGIIENPGIKTLPFLAISKLQQRGLAYAGEGDIIGTTAALMLQCLFQEAIFTETFCPDFEGGRIVMGHMGESNPSFGKRTVLRRKKFVFGDAMDPVIADVHMEEGRATALNLSIVEEGRFQMIAYTGEICTRIEGSSDIDMPYFHFKPDMRLEDLLTEYSIHGGTHHIAMTKGDRREELVKLAELLEIDLILLM
ncbi:MAG: L-arabinose isomerase family protein [Spirochaetota bacterium]